MTYFSEKYLYKPNHAYKNAVNIWMAYPADESFALSSLGYMWLFKALDENCKVNVERIYTNTKATVIKSSELDMIAFSLSFDTDFFNVLSILDKYKIPFKRIDRDDKFPIVFSGGPVVTSNPTPYEEFFDFFIIGDGEVLNEKVVEIYSNSKSKISFLTEISELDGIYVPAFKKEVIKKTEKLHHCIYTPIISDKAYFQNTFIVEIERGCTNRCGFCMASYINLPLRSLPYDNITKVIDLGMNYTDKIALLGAQLSAHPDFTRICEYVYNKSVEENRKIELGVSSLRVDSVTPEIIGILSKLGQRTITLAIEAGSDRLRKVINKNLTNDQILKAVDISVAAGLKGIKFYGIIGLPTETDEDINELVRLAKEIKSKTKGFEISFGFSTFVPKAHTPFQWCGRENTKLLEKKSQYLQKEFHKLGISIVVSSPKWDYWQAVLSRGNSSLTDFLVEVYKNGAKLGAYKQAAKLLNLDTDYFAYENLSTDANLPWDFIKINPQKEFLIKEYNRSLYRN